MAAILSALISVHSGAEVAGASEEERPFPGAFQDSLPGGARRRYYETTRDVVVDDVPALPGLCLFVFQAKHVASRRRPLSTLSLMNALTL